MNVEIDTKVNDSTLINLGLTLALVVAFSVFIIKLAK